MTGDHYRRAPCRASLSAPVPSSGKHKTGVLLLRGNVQISEVSKCVSDNYPLYDFTASGMTYVNPDYANAANKHRVADSYVGHNIGLVDIGREGDPELVIRLRTLSIDGRSGLNYEFSLGDLK